MNKRERVFLCAALLCASGWMSASAAEDPQRVTWVLSGAEGMRYIEVGVPADNDSVPAEKFQREERPAETASESLPAETLRQETVSGSPAAGEMPYAKAPETAAKKAPVKAAVPERAESARPEAAQAEKAAETKTAPEAADTRKEAAHAKPDKKAEKEKSAGRAERKNGKNGETAGASISPENPMTVSADVMTYSGTTGDVDMQGRVDVRHMGDRYETERIYGNSNTQQYVLPGPVKWTAPGNEMTAAEGSYDGKAAVARFRGISGWNKDKYYYEGESGVFDRNENKAVVQKAYLTTKHARAKVPDYRIEADSVDIYPNDHYTAHNAKLYIKNHQILSMKTYNGSLKRDSGINPWSLIPVPDYESDNGFGLKNRVQIPIGGAESDVTFDARIAWYSDAGFKPDVGLNWETAPGTFKLHYVKEESSYNDDHVWVEKWPSFSFDSRAFYIPKTNFYVGFGGELGHWKEGGVSGSYKGWGAYLSHTPIDLGPHLTFDWRIGYRKDYYGYDDSQRSNKYYVVGLSGEYRAVSSWIRYWDNDLNGESPYHYDTYDMEKPVSTGVKVQLTPLDAVGVEYQIDTIDGHTEHRYFTYYRDMHSFYGWITYDEVDDDFEFMIQPKDFSF